MRAPNSSSHELHDVTAARHGCAPKAPRPPPEKRGPNALPRPRPAARPRPLTAAGAAHTRAAMLGHVHRDLRQLFDLMARRLAHRDPLASAKTWPQSQRSASARRARRPPTAATARDRAPHAQAGRPAHARSDPFRARGGAPGGSELGGNEELRELLRRARARASHPRFQLLDPAIHRQQHLDYRLTPRVIDRLRLNALHTPRFDAAELCPPTN